MDQVLVFVAAVTAAFAVGTVVADWRQRKAALDKIDEAVTDLRTTTADIAKAHNGLAQQLLAMQEQINSHELKLGGLQQKGPSTWTAASIARGSPG